MCVCVCVCVCVFFKKEIRSITQFHLIVEVILATCETRSLFHRKKIVPPPAKSGGDKFSMSSYPEVPFI